MISENSVLFYEAVDDAWAYAFVMSLGTRMPEGAVKLKFINFLKMRMVEVQGELSTDLDDIISFIPDFIEHLGGS